MVLVHSQIDLTDSNQSVSLIEWIDPSRIISYGNGERIKTQIAESTGKKTAAGGLVREGIRFKRRDRER